MTSSKNSTNYSPSNTTREHVSLTRPESSSVLDGIRASDPKAYVRAYGFSDHLAIKAIIGIANAPIPKYTESELHFNRSSLSKYFKGKKLYSFAGKYRQHIKAHVQAHLVSNPIKRPQDSIKPILHCLGKKIERAGVPNGKENPTSREYARCP